MTKRKFRLDYLVGLAEHGLKAATFYHEYRPEDKVTIKQFCDELKAEMTYHYEQDVRHGITDEKGESPEK